MPSQKTCPSTFLPRQLGKRDSKTSGKPNGQSIKEEMEGSRTDRGVQGGKIRYFWRGEHTGYSAKHQQII